MKLSARLNQQLNKNNKGASLVTILLVASIVSLLIMVVLAVVILNVFMKKADKQGQGTFYDAESALEEIRAGLAVDVSDATTLAYVDTLSNYANLRDDDGASGDDVANANRKTAYFNKKFLEELGNRIELGANNDYYDVDVLNSYLKETKKESEDSKVGAEILTDIEDTDEGNRPHLSHNTEIGYVLKNVHVRYTDDSGYVSEIKTDIALEYPPVNFQNASSIDNILTYSIIANKSFNPKGTVDVIGNAFLGIDPSDFISTVNVTFKPSGTQETNVIFGNDINLNGATLNTDGVALWADSINLEQSSNFNMLSGSTYLKNDLILGNNSEAKLAGKYIMFGNPWVAKGNYGEENADPDDNYVTSAEVREAAYNDMPAYSSSILVLGSNAGLDMSGLNTMVIGGSAYIDTEKDEHTVKGNQNIVTGQSMALKSDQRAYLIPSTLVGAGLNNGSNFEHGLNNPMTKSQYENLVNDFRSAHSNFSGVVDPDYLVNYALAEPTIGFSLYDFYSAIVLSNENNAKIITEGQISLAYFNDLYVNDAVNGTNNYENALSRYKSGHDTYKDKPTNDLDSKNYKDFIIYEYIVKRPHVVMNAYQTGSQPIIYLFLKFETFGTNFSGQQNVSYIPAEAFYNKWYQMYNSTSTNYLRLNDNLKFYAPKGIKLPAKWWDKTQMYFTGNILSTETNPVIIPDIITQSDFTMDLNIEYSKQSAYYQDAYYTLKKNLSTRYATLTSTMKQNDLFKNIIQTSYYDKVDDRQYSMNNLDYFVSTSGEGAVVTDNNEVGSQPYTYSSTSDNDLVNKEDSYGDTHKDVKINLIIATGDVIVDSDFEGMIIAGGTITVNGGRSVTSAPDKAARAMTAKAYTSNRGAGECAANYIINAEKYTLGGTGRSEDDSGKITMIDFVTYRNWTKQ